MATSRDLCSDGTWIISPNLGFPCFLRYDFKDPSKPENTRFTMNVVANDDLTADQVQNQLADHVKALPLFEHLPGTGNLERGTAIPVVVQTVEATETPIIGFVPIANLYQSRKIREGLSSAWLVRHEIFGKNRALFSVKVDIELADAPEVREWLKTHSFLMFDLVQDSTVVGSESTSRTCYHAIVLRNKPWTTLRLAHVTDIHVAQRYDEILGQLSRYLKPFWEISGLEVPPPKRRETLRQRRVEREVTRETEFNMMDPLIVRFQNPNNKLRQFILWANQAAEREELDMVIMTGDLIDYCLKDAVQNREYNLEDTNWDIFLKILLHDPIVYRPGCTPIEIVNFEELAVPLFTITGNHDVRLHGYPLTALGYYKYFGMNYLEAILYKDERRLSSHKSIIIDKYCLKPYYQFINPFDDYFVELGKNYLLILLNTGADRLLSVKSLLMANPGCVGFKDTQMNLATASISHRGSSSVGSEGFGGPRDESSEHEDEDAEANDINVSHSLSDGNLDLADSGCVLFFSHAPVLNPPKPSSGSNTILHRLMPKRWRQPDEYKESALKARGIENTDISGEFDFAFGTITRNHGPTLQLLQGRNPMMAFAGHTHMLRELRFQIRDRGENVQGSELKELGHDKRIQIRWDDYSNKQPASSIQDNRPFAFQTPSLGISRMNVRDRFGPFRKISLLGTTLDEVDVHYVSDRTDDI
jgi:hypothetical protein